MVAGVGPVLTRGEAEGPGVVPPRDGADRSGGETGRIRVLRIIARLNVGGPAIQASLLTERLDPARYDTLLVAGSEDEVEGDYLALTKQSIRRLHRLPELGRAIRPGQDVIALRKLVSLIRRTKPDIVHTHTAKAGTLGRLAALLCRVPVIVHTYHGHVLSGYFPAWKTSAFTAIERGLSRRTARLIAVSPQVRDDLLARGIGSEARFSVMPLGLDLARFLDRTPPGGLRRELDVPDGVPLVGIVARLVPIKAHEVFLQAARLLVARRGECRFVIVGDGERRQSLEQQVDELGLRHRTVFLGWRGDLDRILPDLDVVALTSRNEGLPVALIEAMAAGRPVVATRVGGVPDLVTDGTTGLLVPMDDAPAVAAAIDRVLTDPSLGASLGRAGRARVYPALSADRLVDDVDRLYQALLEPVIS